MEELLLNERYIFGESNINVDNNHFYVRFSSDSDWTFQYGKQKIKISHAYGSNVYKIQGKSTLYKSLPECVLAVWKISSSKEPKNKLLPAPNAPFYEFITTNEDPEYRDAEGYKNRWLEEHEFGSSDDE